MVMSNGQHCALLSQEFTRKLPRALYLAGQRTGLVRIVQRELLDRRGNQGTGVRLLSVPLFLR